MTADTTPSLVERPWECRWVEPSNAERNEWPATTLEYVSALENSYENLLEEHGAAIGRAEAAEANARRLAEALRQIAKAKPQTIADGFVQGPLALWNWAQRLAKDTLKSTTKEADRGPE